jgi:glycosyltransferase involved in cell wall biosynthesis
MIHSGHQLLAAVKNKIEASQILNRKVHLLGKIDRDKIKMYYNSADYFVAGSHYEGSVYALSEALRCGCVPIVTNIPTFQMMTDNGQLGALWKPGDENSFVEAANFVLGKPLDNERKACIDFFDKNLSFDAIAETAIAHYQKLIEQCIRK